MVEAGDKSKKKVIRDLLGLSACFEECSAYENAEIIMPQRYGLGSI